jgi:hypothetical protein
MLIRSACSTRLPLLLAILASVALLLPAITWPAESRSITIRGSSLGTGKSDIPLYSSYYALVIGCGTYRNGWPALPNPVKDGKLVGLTPCEIKGPAPGKHELSLALAGFEKWSESITLDPGKKLNLALDLTRSPSPPSVPTQQAPPGTGFTALPPSAGKRKLVVLPFLVNGRNIFKSNGYSSKFLEAVSVAAGSLDWAIASSSCYPLKVPSMPQLIGADRLGADAVNRIWSNRDTSGTREPSLGVLTELVRQLRGDLALLYSIVVGGSSQSSAFESDQYLDRLEVFLVDVASGKPYQVHGSSLGGLRLSNDGAQAVTRLTLKVFQDYQNDHLGTQ